MTTPTTAFPNRFRQDLIAGKRLIGCWCSLGSPITTEVLGVAGFHNFLVPYVETADEARRAVAATRYPPAGVRGVSVSQRSNRYGSVADYFKIVNDNIAVMLQMRMGTQALADKYRSPGAAAITAQY